VLAVLAEAWPAAVTRDRLVGLIWPDQDDAGARRLLTQSLYELRRELGDITRSASRDIAVDAEALRVDLIEFRRAIESRDLERAIAIHRGPFLDGFHLRGAPEFEQWATSVRAQTQRQLQQVLHTVVARHEDAEEWRDAARWGEQLVHASPFDADAVARFMRLSERAGDPAAALRAASEYERRMREELELEPDTSIRRRAEEIRAASERPVATALEVVSPVVDAGPAEPPAIDQPGSILKSAPATGTQLKRARRRRVLARTLFVGGALAMLAIAAIASLRRSPGTAARVVVLRPFEVHGDSAAADLAPAISSMLAASLGGSAGVRVDTAAASEAHDTTAWGRIGGDVVVTGRQIRIDAELRTGAPASGVRRA
jgi:DNA-binding SARP family transcriptional activator